MLRTVRALACLVCVATTACTSAAPSQLPAPDSAATVSARGTAAIGPTADPSPASGPCAPDAVLEELLAVSPAERLACLGATTVALRGYRVQVFGAGGCSGDEVPGDGWLRPCAQEGILLSPDPAIMDGLLVLLHPDSGVVPIDVPAGTLIEVVGHLDDPAADDCRLRIDGKATADPAFIQACREIFVATRVEEVDP